VLLTLPLHHEHEQHEQHEPHGQDAQRASQENQAPAESAALVEGGRE
jgi:hypothetical protein